MRLSEMPVTDATALARKIGIEELILIALRREDEIVGFLAVTLQRPEATFPPMAEQIAAGIAPLASLAVQSSRMFEELERANRLKSDFVATMSHELRTPLNVILGYTSLLLEGDFGQVGADLADPLRRIDANGRHLLELVQDTLDVSRLESGRIPIALADVDLEDLLAEVGAETSEARATRPAVEFSLRVESMGGPFRTDRAKLRVVVRNLLLNAFKFTEQGEVRLLARRNEDGVEIAVEDTGIGIAPEDSRAIFEPFHQLGSASERKGGVGLGLYVSARLVEAMGGDIAVAGSVGVGSRFTVRLPEQRTPNRERSDRGA
jgi:signal transduction histidine kinase